MRKHLLLVATGIILLGSVGFVWAQCPQDTIDSGICDTLYVVYQKPLYPIPPMEIHFTLQVSHDVPHPAFDSLNAFVIPLKITHTNPAAYCSILSWRNTTSFTDTANSIFRHFGGMQNRMMSLYEQGNGAEWDVRVLDIHYDASGAVYFWLNLLALGAQDQPWWEGSKTLLATMTLLVEDTMTICIDTCFWPPNSHLAFNRIDANNYVPRHFMPLCQPFGPGPPPHIECPSSESRHTNGTFQTGLFSAWSEQGEISAVAPDFSGTGISNVHVVCTEPPPRSYVEGHVVYTVIDHCTSGGQIRLYAWDRVGQFDYCDFQVSLSNNPPFVDLPDTVPAWVGHTLELGVYASDSDSDSVGITWNAFWYEADSLQAPANPPSYDGGNPGTFIWLPTQADTGSWLSSFSATDVCGAVDTHRITILAKIPVRGDANGDGRINSADISYLTNYLFVGGPTPQPWDAGDTNCDSKINSADVAYLINYLFVGGPTPCQ